MSASGVWLAGAVTLAAIGGAAAGGFDPTAWKAEAGAKAKNTRVAMAADAEAAVRPGMTRGEVEALLGPPDEAYRLHIYGTPASGKALHAKAVRFGPDGRVAKGENDIAKGVSGAGMTAKQVHAVIGEPTEIRDDFVYALGSAGIDPAYLHVEFDEKGALVRRFREQG